MTSDQSSIEAIAYLGCGPNRLSRIELLQQQQNQEYHTAAPPCEHGCNCMHHPLALANHHHHHSNFSTPNVSSNGAYSHHNNISNHNHLNQHQHMHPTSYSMSHSQQQSMLIYNNGSTNSEFNQASNNDSSQSGCSNSNMIHYIPTSNLSTASQSLNIPNVSCECAGHTQQPQQQQYHHQRQSSEQHSLQSGRSSRIISCDENNPSGTEDGSGMSTSGMITACRASKRNL
jgi:hypothetical protein